MSSGRDLSKPGERLLIYYPKHTPPPARLPPSLPPSFPPSLPPAPPPALPGALTRSLSSNQTRRWGSSSPEPSPGLWPLPGPRPPSVGGSAPPGTARSRTPVRSPCPRFPVAGDGGDGGTDPEVAAARSCPLEGRGTRGGERTSGLRRRAAVKKELKK